jgi:membrane-bound lytic murein transglycosylase
MNTASPLLVAVLALGGAASALAQSATYRCVDVNGRSTYTNVKEEMTGKKCTVVSREVSVVPAPPPPPSRPAAAPKPTARVDANTQRNRDETRRKILQEELDAAEKSLAEAKQKLAAQESIRSGDEKNYQRVLDRLKPFQEEVERQEQNVTSLKRELSTTR